MAKRKRKTSAKQRAALARGRATRRRNLAKKKRPTRRKTTRRAPARKKSTRRKTTRRTTRRAPVAKKRRTTRRKRTTSRRRRSSFGGGLVPAGSVKAATLGTVGFVGVQVLVDKAPIPPKFKTGNARIATKFAAAIAIHFALRKVGSVSASDRKQIVIGAMMSPSFDAGVKVIRAVTGGKGLSGIEGGGGSLAGLGAADNPLGIDAGTEADGDEMIALANRMGIAS